MSQSHGTYPETGKARPATTSIVALAWGECKSVALDSAMHRAIICFFESRRATIDLEMTTSIESTRCLAVRADFLKW